MAALELVLVSSSFCGACVTTRERIRMVADAVGSDRMTWREVNVANDLVEAERLDVASTPTVVLTHSSRGEVMRAAGVPTIEQLLAAIADNVDQ